MNIKFDVVTWYSKLLSVIFFIAILPIWTFYLGMKVKEVETYANSTSVTSKIFAGNTSFDSDSMASLGASQKNERKLPKIDVGQSVLEGKAFGLVQHIFEKDGKLWVTIDPADQVSMLECVFRAYDANISQSCDTPNSMTTWNVSTSTISLPVSEKASIAVYYNDGSKIGLNPKIINSKNGKLYQFALAFSTATTSTSTNIAVAYDRILSYDGDDSYKWNPLMYIEIKKGDERLGEDPQKSYVSSIEEVWKP